MLEKFFGKDVSPLRMGFTLLILGFILGIIIVTFMTMFGVGSLALYDFATGLPIPSFFVGLIGQYLRRTLPGLK